MPINTIGHNSNHYPRAIAAGVLCKSLGEIDGIADVMLSLAAPVFAIAYRPIEVNQIDNPLS